MKKERMYWMDMMRGTFILLVILQHWVSIFDFEYISNSVFYNLFYQVKTTFAPFRMEVLFFLSGFIVHMSIKKEFNIYFKGKVDNLLYPYLLWSFLYFVVLSYKSILNGDVNAVMIYFVRILTGSPDLTWFLLFLFLFFMLINFIIKMDIDAIYIYRKCFIVFFLIFHQSIQFSRCRFFTV